MAINKFQLKERSDRIIDMTYERMKKVAFDARIKGRGISEEELDGRVSLILCETANAYDSLLNKIDIE